MWIWYVSQSDGGNLASIVAQAHAAGRHHAVRQELRRLHQLLEPVQPQLVQELHANGLKVCAWQYVYGSNPAGEAELGARAVSEWSRLPGDRRRGRVRRPVWRGADLHRRPAGEDRRQPTRSGWRPSPTSTTTRPSPTRSSSGPDGAQFNAPQMYWKDIGNSVDTAYANTYISNRVYGRPIFPLGQTYSNPSAEELVRFREEAPLYGATGISFWDFQETPAACGRRWRRRWRR